VGQSLTGFRGETHPEPKHHSHSMAELKLLA
jgi:hypothetical protein